jgi:hypothetical protein
MRVRTPPRPPGHTKWSEIRDRAYTEHPGMAERVAARVAQAVREQAQWIPSVRARPGVVDSTVGDVGTRTGCRRRHGGHLG